jgi:SNF2 family DNA or RNA helicase
MPDLLGERQAFLTALQSGESDARFLNRIRKKIRPFILRRKKEHVAKELPERIDQTIWVEMDTEQRHVYEEYLAGVRGGLLKKVALDGVSKHRMEVLEAILRLRQICCHPLLVNAQADSSKLDCLLNDLETIAAEGKKALIYSQFTSLLKLIAKMLRERDFPFCYLDGETKDREKVVSSFQENSEIPFFLISLKAGGVGLNLTAADYVFIYDPWWNEAAEEQAINRAHRIGREQTVIAKRLVITESIEEKMMTLKAKKQALIHSVMEEEAFSAQVTEDDLKFLLA